MIVLLNILKFRLGILMAFGICLTGIALEAAETTNATDRSDFSYFKIITERNIFNPRRSARYVPPGERSTRRSRQADWFVLTGTMTYEKGLFAFFDGTSSDYRKVLKPEEIIASFKITAIEKNVVKLASPTNEMELKVGMQMRKQESGEWAVSERAETFEPPFTYTASSRLIPQSNSLSNNTAQAVAPADEGPEGPVLANDGGENSASNPSGTASTGSGITETDPVLRRLAERAAAERGDAPR